MARGRRSSSRTGSWRISRCGASRPRRVGRTPTTCLNFLRFLDEAGLGLVEVVPTDLFDYLEWQGRRPSTAGRKVVRLAEARGRGLDDEPADCCGAGPVRVRGAGGGGGAQPGPDRPADDQPAGPSPGAAGACEHRGLARVAGWCASLGGCLKRSPPRRCRSFLADLRTCRDRAIVLLMLLGGLRSAEVRSLRLADVDQGRAASRLSARAARSGSSRSMGRSSPSWRPIWPGNGRRGCRPRSASWCCGVRPRGRR
jgi:hypothetical protein